MEDVPGPLRKLPQSALDALALFDVYTGPYEQEYNGYRAHTAPIRFSWKSTSVEERLAELSDSKAWEKGKAAFEWLRDAAGSSYSSFLKAHRVHLRQRSKAIASGDIDPSEPTKWLPMRFMETVGLECAIWPHLYWSTEMTETWARSQDVRRQARARQRREEGENLGQATRGGDSDDEGLDLESLRPQQTPEERRADEGGEESEEEESRRASAKASFVAKVFSPVAGYGACYELQHFVYDLWLASGLGGARNASGISLRGALAGKVFSPMYWQTQHAGLVDCVRQIGWKLQPPITPGCKTSSKSCCAPERSCRPPRRSTCPSC